MTDIHDFIDTFPIGTIITTHEFDQWAIDNNLITDPETDDKESGAWQLLLKQRNNLRSGFNKEGVSLDKPEDRFTIEVYDYGVSYKVFSINDSYLKAGQSLPDKLKKTFNTKVKNLKILSKSSDVEKLPEMLRVEIDMVEIQMDQLSERIKFDLNQSKTQMDVLFEKIRSQAKSIEGTTNGGFAAITNQSEDFLD